MSSKPEFVQIEAGEDVVSLKDRLSFYRGSRVLLVWPEEGTALRRKLDLVLIQREAMRRAIRLALVTHDSEVIKNAIELNISTFETIGASEHSRWKRGRAKVFTNRYQRPDAAPEPDDLKDVASRVRSERTVPPMILRLGVRITVMIMLLAILGVLAYIVIPSATIALTLAEQVIEAEVSVTVDPELRTRQVDVENAIVPAVILRADVTDTASILATGTAESDAARARGDVEFINRTSSVVAIPLNTQVSTDRNNPVVFRTTRETVVPAGVGQTVVVPVEAIPASAGEIGNVAEDQINVVVGPLENSVNVTNPTAMFGGENRAVFVISEADRASLLRQMNAQLQFRASQDMNAQLDANQFVIQETIRLVPQSELIQFSAEVGDRAEVLAVTMSAQVEALAVDELRAQEIVFARMSAQIPRGRVIDPASIRYVLGPAMIDPATGSVSFSMSGSVRVRGQLDRTVLRDRVAGENIDDVIEYLSREIDLADGVEPQVFLSPDWFSRLPILPSRIVIDVESDMQP